MNFQIYTSDLYSYFLKNYKLSSSLNNISIYLIGFCDYSTSFQCSQSSFLFVLLVGFYLDRLVFVLVDVKVRVDVVFLHVFFFCNKLVVIFGLITIRLIYSMILK